MAVVKVRTFQTRSGQSPYLTAEDLTASDAAVDTFLATLTPANVLDIMTLYASVGPSNNHSVMTTTVVYLE